MKWCVCLQIIAAVTALIVGEAAAAQDKSNENDAAVVNWADQLDELYNEVSEDPSGTRAKLQAIQRNNIKELSAFERARIIGLIGNTYVYENRLEEADQAWSEAQDQYRALGDITWVALLYGNRGSVARRQMDHATALEHYKKAIQLVGDENSEVLAQNYNNMGVLFSELNLYDLAINAYEQAIVHERRHIAKVGRDNRGLVNALSNLSRRYIEAGNLDRARQIIAEAKGLLTPDFPKAVSMWVLEAEAKLSRHEEQYDLAVSQYDIIVDYYSSTQNISSLRFAFCDRLDSKILAESFKLPSLLNEAKQCADYWNDNSNPEYVPLSLEMLAVVTLASGDAPRAADIALDAYRKQREFGDTQFQQGIDTAITSLEAEVNRASVRLAERNVEIAERNAIQQRRRFWSAIGVSLLFGAVMVGLGFLLRARMRANAALRASNKQIEDQAEELENLVGQRETLLEELNHRVKNNLQIVAALLGLETDRAEIDSAEASKLRDVQARVMSLASIHEATGSKSASDAVFVDNYLLELTNKLNELYGGRCHYEGEASLGAMLPMRIAAPIGLIIVELVANAYEHGYNNGTHDGEVIIRRRIGNAGATIDIIDHGIGLPSAFNIDSSQSLGLSLVKRLCSQIDAVLSCARDEVQGTVFSIHFADHHAEMTRLFGNEVPA